MSDTSFSHLVVVGSSAGGIEALSVLVSALPEDFAAPIVIAQHLDPKRVSHLREILSRRSPLPVRTVAEHEPLEGGVIFVVPANRHVNITNSEIDLSEDSTGHPKPSVDLLLSSAAKAYGERLIAVVLTGTGSDGADGARDVREAGGTVIVQDPETAEFSSMPRALAPTTVDITAGLERIGPILKELVAGLEVREEKMQNDEKRALKLLLAKLRDHQGVDFTGYKTPTIMRRLKRRMVATDSPNIEAYTRYLDENPDEYLKLINSFLIKVTEFFRDTELFAYLREEVLPRLAEEAREKDNQLRIWSAGCATGEEAYSLAILISEVLNDAGLFNVRIFATDVDEDAVNFARQGIYPASALSGLSEEQVNRYFTRENSGQYQINKSVRSMIVFGSHDLTQRSPFPSIDLVMSRNVLIYFSTELQKRALQLFAYSLRDDGYLVLGKSETNSPLGEFFAPQHRHYKVYRRQGERFLMPQPVVPVTPVPVRPLIQVRGGSGGDLQGRSEPRHEPRRTRTTDEDILNRLPIGVVVDRRYHIQAINPPARLFLSIRGAAVGQDLLHTMREEVPYAEVRRAIDDAFRDGRTLSTGEFAIENVVNGESRYLELVCYAERAEGERGLAETAAVVITDVTGRAQRRRELEKQLEDTRAEFERYRHEADEEAARKETQNERLIETNRQLEETNRELNALNEELQTTYEESLIGTEEAQAATEEVETLNEELQATNEELETVNEELQATIEELNTTNDDLQARSTELQEMARASGERRQTSEASRERTEELMDQLRDERPRLEAILSSMSDSVLAVNTEAEVLFSNDGFKKILGDGAAEETDAGADLLGRFVPLDENGERLPPEASPRALAARGESFDVRFTVEGEDGARRRFEARGRPISGENGGGVIVVREVTEDQ